LLSTFKSAFRPMFMAASLFALAASAQATIVTFGTGGTSGFTGGGSSDSGSVGGGITLTATPWASGYGDESLTVSWDGYGVDSGRHDDAQIDGDGRDEAVILTFSTAVRVNSIGLRGFSGNDDVDLFVDGNSWNGNPVVGTVFTIRADDRNSEFRVRTIDFDAISSTSPVPEPASLLTAGLGLGLLGFARFRRK